MRPTSAPLATVRTATRAAPHRPGEDRVFVTEGAVVVLDGASQPEPGEFDGGWMADTLGHEIRRRLAAGHAELDDLLADAIAEVVRRNGLAPGRAPSTTVSIVRWTATAIDVLVLGDSPVVARTVGGAVVEVRDDRLRRVGAELRARLRSAADADRQRIWRSLVEVERAERNTDGGYWIAEVVPEAARHACRARWDRREVDTVLVMTDGVSVGVDRYGVPPDWPAAIDLATGDPSNLIAAVHGAEAGDPDRRRWPRSKRHDDKALAVVGFRSRTSRTPRPSARRSR